MISHCIQSLNTVYSKRYGRHSINACFPLCKWCRIVNAVYIRLFWIFNAIITHSAALVCKTAVHVSWQLKQDSINNWQTKGNNTTSVYIINWQNSLLAMMLITEFKFTCSVQIKPDVNHFSFEHTRDTTSITHSLFRKRDVIMQMTTHTLCALVYYTFVSPFVLFMWSNQLAKDSFYTQRRHHTIRIYLAYNKQIRKFHTNEWGYLKYISRLLKQK